MHLDRGNVVLRADGLGKHFGPVRALRDVSLDVRAGEVLALMGENGAGKSTLLRILSGDHVPDEGRILLDGEPASFSSPRAAHAAGIRVIYQEPEIIRDVSVAENVYVGALPARWHRFSRRELHARVREDIDRLGFTGVIDAATPGSRLSPAQRQLVEVLRALVSDVRVIAFDEPTSSLSDHEVEALFALVRRLRQRGVAVMYVSHRLKEIFQIADRVAVLRDGELVGERRVADTGEAELVRMMVGRDLGQMFSRNRAAIGDVVLDVEGISTDDVHEVSLQVRAGEVVALAGLVGAGRTELARALAGDVAITAGEIRLGGRKLRLRSPRDAVRAGIGLAPEERKAEALLLNRSVRDNITLAVLDRLRRLRIVRRDEERRVAREFSERLRIRTPSIEQPVSTLSGGNQQKTVLARWLARRPRVLILDEPTRGIDVGAKAEIYSIVDDLAREGIALLVISSELPEVLGLADRIVVMGGGRVTGELDRAEATEERVLTLAIDDHAERGHPA
ncbi:MAG: L-arabinose transport system ATP-binding protein [Solirubrobacteraceae bacterium]|nr:L-arabinose transport system ATP-binding protein [Solirubrobacteraceae bacterium]